MTTRSPCGTRSGRRSGSPRLEGRGRAGGGRAICVASLAYRQCQSHATHRDLEASRSRERGEAGRTWDEDGGMWPVQPVVRPDALEVFEFDGFVGARRRWDREGLERIGQEPFRSVCLWEKVRFGVRGGLGDGDESQCGIVVSSASATVTARPPRHA